MEGPIRNPVINLLLREYLFSSLTLDQVKELAYRFDLVDYAPNQVVFNQGDSTGVFYIVLKGSFRATRLEGGKQRELNIHGPGHFFGEGSLLFDRPLSATVTALEQGVLLQLGDVEFGHLLEDYPAIREILLVTAQSREKARGRDFDWLTKDEVVVLVTRRHPFFLVQALILPSLIFMAGAALFGLGWLQRLLLFMGSGAVLAGLGFLWGLWSGLDWSNDYYIITNKRVIWLEKIIALYDSRREAPLETVLATDLVASFLGRMLDYGDVNVRTYTGNILMRNMPHPRRFTALVDGYKVHATQVVRETESRVLQRDVQSALRHSFDPNAIQPSIYKRQEAKPAASSETRAKRSSPFSSLFRLREEEDGIVTYHKHWFSLIKEAWLPQLALLAWVGAVAGLAWADMFNTLLLIFAIFSFLGILGWLVYEYLDWANEIYRLTPNQILDIDRTPLGREEKKTANLDSPDFRVVHERANILGILFNFGNVIVKIGQTEFTFENVYNPDQVHQDVVTFREAFQARKRAAEAQSDRQRLLDYLVAYHDVTDHEEDNLP